MSREAGENSDAPTGPPEADGPLKGLRVLDVARILAGPIACQILGDFGADVVKIEHPDRGDDLRHHGPQKDGIGLWWKVVGRNKRSVGLDLSREEGAAIFLRLVESADVVVESFRPGTLERWGLSYDQLAAVNPKVVLVRISGFGQEGPYAHRPGFGTLAEAMSGFAAMTGEPDGPPLLPPFGLADGIAGIMAATAALIALYRRDHGGGEGQVADLALFEPIVSVIGAQATVYQQLGQLPSRQGNRSDNNAPRNLYRASDGRWVAVSASATAIAERILRLVGHPELTEEPWFASGRGRAEHGDEIDALVGDWIAKRSAEEVVAAFEAAEAAIAPVYDIAGLIKDRHVRARGTFVELADPQLGALLMPNVMARLSKTPGQVRFAGRPLGADTESILVGELGISPERLAELKSRGVVG